MKQMCAALVVVMALAAYPVAQSQTATDIVGNWDITTVSPLGESTNNMVVSQEGSALESHGEMTRANVARQDRARRQRT